MDSLIVYHGTNALFDKADLTKARASRDFGRGFYTTTISSQAESWARSIAARRLTGEALVNVYEMSFYEGLSVKRFEGLTVEWLDFVRDNRIDGGTVHDFDVVVGPVADDSTLLTVNRYMQGVYTSGEALARLAYSKSNDQVSLHTERALECLKFIRRYRVE